MNKKFSTRNLVLAGLLIALSIVFSRLFSIRVSEGLRLSFGQTPIIISGLLLGPIWGLCVGALADVTGYIINPMGAYLPGLTLCSAMVGLVPGLIKTKVIKNKTNLAIMISAAIVCLIINGLFATYFLSLAYSSRGFVGWLVARMPVEVVMTVVQSVVCIAIVASTSRFFVPKK